MKRIVIDLDDTLCRSGSRYADAEPNRAVIEKLKQLQTEGYEVVVFTSRNMRTYGGNLGKINLHTLPTILEWLRKNGVTPDELLVGKPWCGEEGFYVDDRAIRPDEFVQLDLDQIRSRLKIGK